MGNPFVFSKWEDVIKIVNIDPTNNKIYLQWLLERLLKLEPVNFNTIITEDNYKWNEYLSIYDKVKSKLPIEQRDINKLSLEDLKKIALQYKGKEEELLTKNDYLDKKYKIKDAEGFDVYMFKTSTETDFKMYQLVSTNTEWCTRPEYDTFKYYVEKSPLFVFINKINRSEKYQFHEESEQFMDAEDWWIKDELKFRLIPLISDYLQEDFIMKVYIDGSYGFINKQGEFIAKGFKNTWNFSEGLAIIQFQNYSYGFINKQGKVLVNGFLDAWAFSGGIALVKFQDNSWGYLSKDLKFYENNKKTLIPKDDPRLKGIQLFPENLN